MIFRPTFLFLTGPFPPGFLAARFLAAVIRPPLLFFATLNHLLSGFPWNTPVEDACQEGVRRVVRAMRAVSVPTVRLGDQS